MYFLSIYVFKYSLCARTPWAHSSKVFRKSSRLSVFGWVSCSEDLGIAVLIITCVGLGCVGFVVWGCISYVVLSCIGCYLVLCRLCYLRLCRFCRLGLCRLRSLGLCRLCYLGLCRLCRPGSCRSVVLAVRVVLSNVFSKSCSKS